MPVYGIYRNGSNATNQSMCERMLVAHVEAPNREAAVDAAHELEKIGRFTLYANQYLSVTPASKILDEEWYAMCEEEVLEVPACNVCDQLGAGKIERWRHANWVCAKCK